MLRSIYTRMYNICNNVRYWEIEGTFDVKSYSLETRCLTALTDISFNVVLKPSRNWLT